MQLKRKHIAKYLQGYLNKIFEEDLFVEIQGDSYVLNQSLKIPIYDFWNKEDDQLLEDFEDYSLKDDWIGTIFFFLSGYWEYMHPNTKDKYGRYPALESFQYKKGILEEPVVDILVEKIRKELNLSYKDNEPKIYLTHDIDLLALLRGRLFVRTISADILKRKDIPLVWDRIKRKLKGKDPFSAHNLIELHRKYNTTGTFFFLTEKQEKKFSGGYSAIKNKNELQEIANAVNVIEGSIGLHYDSRYLLEDRLKNDKQILEKIFNQKIDKGRAHYLLFDIRKTFDILENVGIKIDSTGGYADKIGFRFGTGRPFRPYNFKTNSAYNVWEIPLIVMDGTLVDEKYMNLSPEEGLEKVKELMDKVSRYNGVFTLLWHNTSFYTDKWEDWESVYENVIEYAREKGFESLSLKSITI